MIIHVTYLPMSAFNLTMIVRVQPAAALQAIGTKESRY